MKILDTFTYSGMNAIVPVYMDGFEQGWYTPSQVILSKMPRYAIREVPDWYEYGQRYLVRYEPRSIDDTQPVS